MNAPPRMTAERVANSQRRQTMGTLHERDSPPTGFTLRPAQESDIPAIIALMDAYDASFNHTVMSYDPDDIRNDWNKLSRETDTWAISAPDGALVAYATVIDEGLGQIGADGYIHPNWRGRGLGALVLRLTERRARQLIGDAPVGARVTLLNSIVAEDTAAQALLEATGYTLARIFWRMRIELNEAPTAPTWPAGTHVRIYDPDRDAHAVYELVETAFGDHWGHTPQTFKEWMARVDRDSFDPTLWHLAESDDGELAAVALGRYLGGQGWIRSVATARAWRNRGLARALLLHSFGEFWRRGERVVGLGVDSQSLTGATHLYESIGMWPEMRILTYEKILRDGEQMVVRSLES
jgi:GNAT superfamily N-acetyltransferase